MQILSTGTSETAIDVRNVTIGADGFQLQVNGTNRFKQYTGVSPGLIYAKVKLTGAIVGTSYNVFLYISTIVGWPAASLGAMVTIVATKTNCAFVVGPVIADIATEDYILVGIEDSADADASVNGAATLYVDNAYNSTTGSPVVSVGDVLGATPLAVEDIHCGRGNL